MNTQTPHVSLWFKTLVPCALVGVLAVVTLVVWLPEEHSSEWPVLISAIQSGDDPTSALLRAEAWLDLQQRAQSLPEGSPERRQVADLHFQLAEALSVLATPESIASAIQHYEHAAALVPSLRHGWLFFRWGDALQVSGDVQAAADVYQQVGDFDSGRLALEAGYRALAIEAADATRPLNVMPLFAYLRYGTARPLLALEAFTQTTWNPSVEATFVEALQAEHQGNRAEALSLMSEYQRLRPTDPHAWVWLDAWQQINSPRIVPERDLLSAFHAPRSFHADVLRMPHDTQLRTSIHVPDGVTSVRVQWHYHNPTEHPLEFYLLSGDTRQTVASSGEGTASAEITVTPGWNPIELHVFFLHPQASIELPMLDMLTVELLESRWSGE